MSASPAPPAAAIPSQKRPLEDPSSDAGPGDLPEAKRQAVDGLHKEELANGQTTANGREPNGNLPAKVEMPSKADITNEVASDAMSITNSTEAAATLPPVPETQPIQSSVAARPAVASPSNFQTTPQDESGWLHMRAIISSAEAATIIGKGGENVTMIRKMANAKCTISDYTRGAVERILTVSGQVDAVAKVRQFGLSTRCARTT